jgi:hypothetical protein
VKNLTFKFIYSASSYSIINSVPFDVKQEIMRRDPRHDNVVHAEPIGSAVMILTCTVEVLRTAFES